MKKQLIAVAALSALCGSALAQSNVTIYGVMDINYSVFLGDGKRMNAVDPGGISGSRLGFKGSEDLGDGLKAVYRLEFGSLKNDISSGITSTRESYVGLQGNWGTLIGGYLYSPADDMNSGYDGLSNSGLLSARSNMLNDGGFSTKVDDTFENAVGYISPDLKGLTLRAVFGLGEQTEDPKEKKYAFGAEYIRGPFKTALVYHYIDNLGGTEPETDKRELALAAAYDFKVVKLLASYVAKKQTGFDRDKTWAVGAHIPAGPGTVRLSYAKLDMSKQAEALGRGDAKGWTAAYFYEMSKRTTVYTGYHALDNSDESSYNHERLTGLSAGSEARLFTVGMRHKF